MQPNFVLYNYYRSSASYRVRIAMNLKGLPYDYRSVHLINNGGEQLKPEYKAMNPSGDVPTLVHNGRTIAQSVAIIDYVDRVAPEPPLFSPDPYKRSLILQACEIANSGVQPLHNLRVLKKLETDFSITEAQKNAWTVDWITYGLTAMEAFLKPHAKSFSFGDDVSAADCFVIPLLFGADRFKVPFTGYPTLSRIRATCEGLEPFKDAHPTKQPDFQN